MQKVLQKAIKIIFYVNLFLNSPDFSKKGLHFVQTISYPPLNKSNQGEIPIIHQIFGLSQKLFEVYIFDYYHYYPNIENKKSILIRQYNRMQSECLLISKNLINLTVFI